MRLNDQTHAEVLATVLGLYYVLNKCSLLQKQWWTQGNATWSCPSSSSQLALCGTTCSWPLFTCLPSFNRCWQSSHHGPGDSWWGRMVRHHPAEDTIKVEFVTPVQPGYIVSTNGAGLSPREQGNIGKKAQQRGLKLQALKKDEDSAGWGKEVRNLPQSYGRGTCQLIELSELRPFCNIPQTCQDIPCLFTN